MRRLFYTLLMILFLPVLLIGLTGYFVPIIWYRGRISGTAYEPLNWRVLYHLVGSRPDPISLQLAQRLPATNPVFLWFMVRPAVLIARFTGYTPVFLAYPSPQDHTPLPALIGARCEFHDQAMQKHIMDRDQVVLLGAGWDSRAYGLLREKKVRIFEVDLPATQAMKRAALSKSGIDTAHVIFAVCDLNHENWLDVLQQQGFDPRKRTFVLWEAVSMYLEEQAVQKVLRIMAELPPGSRLAFEVINSEWEGVSGVGKLTGLVFKLFYGEPFTFGLPISSDPAAWLSRYLKEFGLTLEKQFSLRLAPEDEIPYGSIVLAKKT